MEENDGKAVLGRGKLRHCYRCNKSGVPIKDALCDRCKEEILRELTPAEWLVPFGIVALMSLGLFIFTNG